MRFFDTLVRVHTGDTVPGEAKVAGTTERAHGVGTGGLGRTVIRSQKTLVHIATGTAVRVASIARVAGAAVGAGGVGAEGHGGTVVQYRRVRVEIALVNVLTRDAVPLVTERAGALEGAHRVLAIGGAVGRTVGESSGTLVQIPAAGPTAGVARVAGTAEGARGVDTEGLGGAVMQGGR